MVIEPVVPMAKPCVISRHPGNGGIPVAKAAAARNSLTAPVQPDGFRIQPVQQTQGINAPDQPAGFYPANESDQHALDGVRAGFFRQRAESFIILLRHGIGVDRALNSLDILAERSTADARGEGFLRRVFENADAAAIELAEGVWPDPGWPTTEQRHTKIRSVFM